MPKAGGQNKLLRSNTDKNERFVLQNCIAYLNALISPETILHKEIFGVISWILGDKFRRVEKQLCSMLSKKELEQRQYDIDNANNTDNSIDLIHKILYTSPKSRVIKFITLVRKEIAIRNKSLAYRGKSEIEKNIQSLVKKLNLTQDDIKLCTFLYITTAWHKAEEYFVTHLKCNAVSGRRYLKAVLQMTEKQINAVLSGSLVKIELCAIKNNGFAATDDFTELLLNPSDEGLESKYFNRVTTNTNRINKQETDHQKTEHVLKLLSAKRQSATHILLHGASGSGKTSYAYSIANESGLPAYEVANNENKSGSRKAAITACINATNNKYSLIIIDNADAVLRRKYYYSKDWETEDKCWLINTLKKPATKIIWIVNNIDEIDTAVLKQFSFSLEFKQINRRQRIGTWKSILNKHRLKNNFSDKELEELSKYPVNTDVIDRCVKMAIDIALPEKNHLKEIVIKNVEAQMELVRDKANNKDKIEDNYSLEGLNVEGDLPTIMCQLEAFDKYLQNSDRSLNRNFNLLFYGPPGTGKSELARYIGKHLGREIMCKRASDIISKWVGETEQNINKVFRQAEEEDIILIIDEADTFLYSREWAIRSFEIRSTNEFLTQMERFRGILICTTNILQGLDSASIRRFNHKIKFDYLKPEGNVIFYQKLLASLVSNPLNDEIEDELRRIRQLTPGDFRIVRDRYSFYKPQNLSHQLLLESLTKEASIKQFQRDGGKRIGF